jgi:hypothetical protein
MSVSDSRAVAAVTCISQHSEQLSVYGVPAFLVLLALIQYHVLLLAAPHAGA